MVVTTLRGTTESSVLELGTGTGAIAVAIAREVSGARVVATDSSADALTLAAANLIDLRLEETVELRQGSWFEPIGEHERFHVICANPPYISEEEWMGLNAVIRDWEPRGALVAGPTGYEAYEVIFRDAGDHLEDGMGTVVVEIGAGQGERVQSIARAGGFAEVVIRHDLAGRDRFVVARS
jgi:release factor glutamine methyltransferase